VEETIEQAVIPCAGRGTRTRALRLEGPKETILLAGKPLVRRAAEEAFRGGVRRVLLVIAPGKEEVERYFRAPVVRRDLEIDGRRRVVGAIVQERPTGLADALALARRELGEEPFALILPDNYYDGVALAELIPVHRKTGRSVAGLLSLEPERWAGFGNCGNVETSPEDDRLRIRSLAPKGKGRFRGAGPGPALRWYGRVILTPTFFRMMESVAFPEGEERDDVPVLRRLVQEEGVAGVRLSGRGFDVGNPTGFAEAERWLLRKKDGPEQ